MNKENIELEHKSFKYLKNKKVINENIEQNKENIKRLKYHILKNINAMANTKGGTIVIGLKDYEKGVELDEEALWEEQPLNIYKSCTQDTISDWINTYLDGNPVVFVKQKNINGIDSKIIIEIEVLKLEVLTVSFKKDIWEARNQQTFIRSNNGIVPMSSATLLEKMSGKPKSKNPRWDVGKEEYTNGKVITFLIEEIFLIENELGITDALRSLEEGDTFRKRIESIILKSIYRISLSKKHTTDWKSLVDDIKYIWLNNSLIKHINKHLSEDKEINNKMYLISEIFIEFEDSFDGSEFIEILNKGREEKLFYSDLFQISNIVTSSETSQYKHLISNLDSAYHTDKLDRIQTIHGPIIIDEENYYETNIEYLKNIFAITQIVKSGSAKHLRRYDKYSLSESEISDFWGKKSDADGTEVYEISLFFKKIIFDFWISNIHRENRSLKEVLNDSEEIVKFLTKNGIMPKAIRDYYIMVKYFKQDLLGVYDQLFGHTVSTSNFKDMRYIKYIEEIKKLRIIFTEKIIHEMDNQLINFKEDYNKPEDQEKISLIIKIINKHMNIIVRRLSNTWFFVPQELSSRESFEISLKNVFYSDFVNSRLVEWTYHEDGYSNGRSFILEEDFLSNSDNIPFRKKEWLDSLIVDLNKIKTSLYDNGVKINNMNEDGMWELNKTRDDWNKEWDFFIRNIKEEWENICNILGNFEITED